MRSEEIRSLKNFVEEVAKCMRQLFELSFSTPLTSNQKDEEVTDTVLRTTYCLAKLHELNAEKCAKSSRVRLLKLLEKTSKNLPAREKELVSKIVGFIQDSDGAIVFTKSETTINIVVRSKKMK